MRIRWMTLVVVAALTAAACGGDGNGSSGVASLKDAIDGDQAVAAAADAETDLEEAMLAFTACLREHGLDVEDPTVDADGNVQFGRFGGGPGAEPDSADREARRVAQEACQEHLDGVTLGFRDRDTTEFQDQLIEYAACMRNNGYDMPDPDFSGSGTADGPGGGPFGQFDPSDPDFRAAQEACQDVLPGFARGGGPGPRLGGGAE